MRKFEERLERLEELADRIKQPDLPLEEAVSVFEEGVKLARGLERDLDRIQGKVEILLAQPATDDSRPELGLFDGEEEE